MEVKKQEEAILLVSTEQAKYVFFKEFSRFDESWEKIWEPKVGSDGAFFGNGEWCNGAVHVHHKRGHQGGVGGIYNNSIVMPCDCIKGI